MAANQKPNLFNMNSIVNFKFQIYLGCAVVIMFCLSQIHHYRSLSFNLPKVKQKRGQQIKQCEANQPVPFVEEMISLNTDMTPVNCMSIFNKITTLNEPAYEIIQGNYLHKLRDVAYPCCMQPFVRDGDEGIKFSGKCKKIVTPVTKIPKHVQYIQITCMDGNVTKYRDAFAVVHPKKLRKNTVRDITAEPNKLNVIILGFDSTSQQNFNRKARKSRDYLVDTLSAVPLKYYNKVGYNTLPNTAALMTGKSIHELIGDCARPKRSGRSKLNHCPLIWKRFANRGYLTSFMEDCTWWSLLNHDWHNAFPLPPTDYYYRPLALYMDSLLPSINDNASYCHGPRLSFVSMINYAKMIADLANSVNQPYFQFLWTSRQTHRNMDGLRWLDDHLLKALHDLKQSNALNSTAILIVGDHGYHFNGQYGPTSNWEIEDKMPVGYLVLPPWFKEKYAVAFQNLLKNSQQKTTPYDVHATLLNLRNLKSLRRQSVKDANKNNRKLRGMSLFKNIPEDRTCTEAGIPLRWCILCHPKIPLKRTTPMVQNAANFLLDSINAITVKDRDSCLHLTMKAIQNALKWDPRDVYSAMCHPNRKENIARQELAATCDFTDVIEIVEITITTSPNNATFVGEVMRLQNEKWVLNENATRIDSYLPQSNCTRNKGIKPYCFCTTENLVRI